MIKILLSPVSSLTFLSLQTSRLFSSTSFLGQRPDHRLYKEISWDQVRGGNYAVVDPMDPSNILYLSARSYIASQKTWISNDIAVVVLATPKDNPHSDETSSSSIDPKNSPRKSNRSSLFGWGVDTVRDAKGRVWGAFTSPMIKFINHYVSSKSIRVNSEESENIPQPAIEINNRNIVDLTLEWGHCLHFKLFGLAPGRGFRDSLVEFSDHVALIYRTQGGLQLTKRLKIYVLVIKSFLGKNPMTSTQALGYRIRLCNGLPKALPPQARSVLRSRPVQSIRLWISLLHYYKAMVIKVPMPDLSGVISTPITLPDWIVVDFSDFISGKFKSLFKDVLSRRPRPDYSEPEYYSSFKSGPNMRPAIKGILPDLFGWIRALCENTGFTQEYAAKNPVTRDTKVKDLVTNLLAMCKHAETLVAKSLNGCSESISDLRTTPIFRFPLIWGIEKWIFPLILKMIPEIESQVSNQTGYDKSAGTYDFMALYLDMEREAKGIKTPETPKLRSKERASKEVYDWHDKLFAAKSMEDSLPDFYHETPGNLGNQKWEQGFPTWGFLGMMSDDLAGPVLTKIAFLSEPAGKVRIIAIVDWWTQQILKPIHDWMFELLRSLPTDATFSQEGSLRSFAKEVGKEVYSFDLKSATEMIPQILYRIVFEAFWSKEKSESWMALLTERWFHYRYFDEATNKVVLSGVTKYRRGQPMGALSSWASMALVHHAIVQYSAHKVSLFPFFGYRILGDDIVIGSSLVAKSYLEVCKIFQIPISLPKSLQSSNGFFDFASQILQYMRNFSPISLREELSAYNPSKRVEMALRLVRRGLVDFSKPSWFSDYLKLIVSSTVYKQIQDARKLGKLDAAAKAVLIQTLGTLEISPPRFGLFGLPRVTIVDSIKVLLPTMGVFRTDFKTSLSLGNDKVNDSARDIACEAICYKANFLYAKYLKLRPTFQEWKAASSPAKRSLLIFEALGPDNKYLAKLLSSFPTISRKLEIYTKWEEKYRRPLKTIQVLQGLRPISADLFEHTTEMTLDESWQLVCQAEAELMLKPDMVFGVAPAVVSKNILKPTAVEIFRNELFFTRLGVWSEIASISNS